MKTITSFALVILLVVGVYLGLYYGVGVSEDVAKAAAILLFSAFPQIDQALKQGKFELWRPTWPKDVVRL